MDWINTILSDPALLAAIVGVLIVVFKDKPIIRQLLMAILPIITPKPVPLPQSSGTTSHSIEIINPPMTAVEHYRGLCECCEDCPEAKAALKQLWVHLDPADDAA